MNPRNATLILAFAAIGAGCPHKEDEKEKPPEPRKVVCAPVETREISDGLEVRGTVSPLPDRDAQVAPQVAGRIVRIGVREGDPVKSGQVLAQVDDSSLVDQVSESDATLAKVRAELKNAETTAARVEKVFEQGIAARQEVEDAQARASAAKAAEAEAVAVAQRNHRQLERATVRSPLNGVVLKLLRRSGELVDGTPATPVVEVGDPSQLELVADVAAQDLVRIRKGDKATVTLPALPGRTFQSLVSAVAPAVDRATGLGTVRFSLDLSGGVPPPVGVLGVARESIGEVRQAHVVPAAALRNSVGGQAEVVVCGADKSAHVVKIQRGIDLGDVVEIRGKLPGDEKAIVAVDPVLGIADKDPLEIDEGHEGKGEKEEADP